MLGTCKQCGKPVSDKAVRCPHCGRESPFAATHSDNNAEQRTPNRAEQRAAQPTHVPPPASTKPALQNDASSQNGSNSLVVGAIVIAVAVAVVVVVVVSLNMGRQSPLTTEEPAQIEAYEATSSPQTTEPSVANDYAPRPGQEFDDCDGAGWCPRMVVIPAGSFLMGSSDSETHDAAEVPQHRVSMQSFAVGKFEVSLGEWSSFVSATNRPIPPYDCYVSIGTDQRGANWQRPGFEQDVRHPVVCVSWQDASDYTAWLSQVTGRAYHLLSEAEFEYAARGGRVGDAYWWGPVATDEYMNYGTDTDFQGAVSGRDEWAHTSPAGSFPPNPFGIHDMHGNAWEWTRDCWNATYVGAPLDGSAWISGDCSKRVMRGGSWAYPPFWNRSAYRDWQVATTRGVVFGFRVARQL